MFPFWIELELPALFELAAMFTIGITCVLTLFSGRGCRI